MKTRLLVRVAWLAIAALGAGCGRNADRLATAPEVRGVSSSSNIVTLPFDAAHFQNPKANVLFPLVPGTTDTYRGVSKQGIETNTVEVTQQTRTILGVSVVVVHDRVYIEDGSLSEDTFDWYAADQDGNVWYFGEDTKEYDHGTLVTTEGSWEAGKNGAQPGIIMLANPEVGDQYQQENSPGVVADVAKVLSLDETVTVAAGTFTHCLKTREWTPLEPGVREAKFYAPGIGVVLETSTRQGGERVELTRIQ
jgi:hypothetical protein